MGRYFKNSLFVLILFCIALACDGSGTNSTTTRTIGPGGGTITSADGRLTLQIPEGALDQATEITIRKLNPRDFEEMFGKSPDFAYQLEPDGLEFNVPVTATLEQDEKATDSEGNISFKDVLLLSVSGNEIEMLDNQLQVVDGDTDENTVSGELTHFSELLSFIFEGFVFFMEELPDSVPPETTFTVTVQITATDDISDLISYTGVDVEDKSVGAIDGLFDSFSFVLPSSRGDTDEEMLLFLCGEGMGSALVEFDVFINEIFPLLPFPILSSSSSTSKILGGKVSCMEDVSPTQPPASPTPTPPPPTPQPTPPPVSNCADFSGVYDLMCDLVRDPFMIVSNFGDPYIVSVEINIDPVTNVVTVEAAQGETTPFIPLEGAADFITTFGTDAQLFELRETDGSRCEFDAMGGAFINGGDLLGEAEGWGLAFDAIGNEIVLGGSVLNINFEILPAPNQSTVYECEGQKAGQ